MSRIRARPGQAAWDMFELAYQYVRSVADDWEHWLTRGTTTAETVDNMIALAFVMLQRRCRSRCGGQAGAGVISRRQLQWYV